MSKDDKSVSLFVPGRLCLFGEHTDWAAEYGRHRGFCLVVGTDQGLSGEARASDSFTVETLIPDKHGRPSGRRRQMSCTWDLETLTQAAKDQDEFFRYAAGVAYQMCARPEVSGGLDLRITGMDLPLRKGVSSSAAVCILVAQAFNEAYELRLFPHELMELAYLGEKLTGSQCGRMDQACIYGKTPVLLTFDKSVFRKQRSSAGLGRGQRADHEKGVPRRRIRGRGAARSADERSPGAVRREGRPEQPGRARQSPPAQSPRP